MSPRELPATWGDLLRDLPSSGDEEVLTELLACGPVRIERIVSTGQRSPEGFWYDQPQGEWVVVIAGRAAVEVEGRGEVELGPGGYLHLPPRCRHRVSWTSAAEPTVWLAVHYRTEEETP